MEKEEKKREEKDVYTLVEGGEGERERDEINLGGGLGVVLRRLGGQDSKRARGISFLGTSWSHLGGHLGRLGGFLRPFWRSGGRRKGSK